MTMPLTAFQPTPVTIGGRPKLMVPSTTLCKYTNNSQMKHLPSYKYLAMIMGPKAQSGQFSGCFQRNSRHPSHDPKIVPRSGHPFVPFRVT